LLEHPGAARLLIDLPIRLGNGCRRHQAVWIEVIENGLSFALPNTLAYPRSVHARIDDQMGDVDVLWPQFTGCGLRHRAQAEFGACKRCVTRPTAKASRRSSKEDAASAVWQHAACRLAAGQKSRVACHLPDLAKDTLSRIEQRKVDVCADVEHADFQRRMRVGIR